MADYSSWAFKRTLTLDTTVSGADVSGTVLTFPILVRITATEMDFSQADTNGEDIRFTADDESTDLDFEIERWDDSGSLADVRVRIPSVAGNDTTDIKMFWGKSGQASASSPSGTFKTADDFHTVWHLNENGNTTADGYKDATANANDGTGVSMTGASDVTGIIDKAQDFDGSNDYIKRNFESVHDLSAYTISFWVKAPSQSDRRAYGEADSGGGNQCCLIGSQNSSPNNKARVFIRNDDSGGALDKTGTVVVFDDTWHMVTFTDANGTYKLYVDGILDVSGSYTKIAKTLNDTTLATYLRGSPSALLNGTVDELQLSDVVRDEHWVKLSFENQQAVDTLITFGAVIEVGNATPYYYNNLLTGT